MFEEQLLNLDYHNRRNFTSGISELDEYIQRFAAQQSKKNIAVVRVLVDSTTPHVILGYYSLSAAQIDVMQLDDKARKKLPRYPIPCFRMGRLAVHSAHQGRGLGGLLIGCVIERCLEAKKQVAAYALIVDAKGNQAKKFYEHYGFIACYENPMTLYLPLGG